MLNLTYLNGPDLESLNRTLTHIEDTLTRNLELLRSGHRPDGLVVDQLTNQVTGFLNRYQDVLVAGSALGQNTLVDRVKALIIEILGEVTTILDELIIAPDQVKTTVLLSEEKLLEFYALRVDYVKILSKNNNLIQKTLVPRTPNTENTSTATEWIPLQSLTKKSIDDLLRVISRAITVEKQIDYDIGTLLAVIIEAVHVRPDIGVSVPSEYRLTQNPVALNTLVDSSEFRDYIAAPFAPLLKKLIALKPLFTHDEDIRAMYLSSLRFINRYYVGLLAEHPDWQKQDLKPIEAARTTPEQPVESTTIIPPPPAPPRPTQTSPGTEELKPIDLN